jgi:Fimbrial assembly protein (PilN).
MQFNSSRSDVVRNISIIEFLFVIVLLVLAHFSYQVEQTNQKENKITLLVLEIKDLKEDIKKLQDKNSELQQIIKELRLKINDPETLKIFDRNEELKKKLMNLKLS